MPPFKTLIHVCAYITVSDRWQVRNIPRMVSFIAVELGFSDTVEKLGFCDTEDKLKT